MAIKDYLIRILPPYSSNTNYGDSKPPLVRTGKKTIDDQLDPEKTFKQILKEKIDKLKED
jgi:hypothetical protein